MSIERNSRFAGRRVYLTGAASGIGLATARMLAHEGGAVALVDIEADGLEAARAETGGIPFAVDLRDGAAIDRSVAAAAAALGGLDCVINCAGVASSVRLEALVPAEWDRVIAINLTAPYRVCRAALPWLRAEPRGSIVNVSSGTALLPTSPGASAYVASKGGLLSFTKALATEIAPTMRANVVCPGVVETPMTSAMLVGDAAAKFLGQYALRRAADAREVAEAIVFLASDEASFITGAVLAVDGGRTFH